MNVSLSEKADDNETNDHVNIRGKANGEKKGQHFFSILEGIREDREKVTGYVENVIPIYLPDDFNKAVKFACSRLRVKRMFRVSRETYSKLLGYVSRAEEFALRNPNRGRSQIPLEKVLLIVLWYIGTQESAQSISDRFGVQQFTFYKYQEKVMDYFCNILCSWFIVWPKEDEKNEIIRNFQSKKGFPDVIGALDGSHIPITPPKDRQGEYINRKGFHSVVLQAVCRPDKRFTHIYCGWPG
ncbi:uncharacterized protein LOC123529790 [Mercenaria mercenaria]|uniref:uncharacterized protein LOC123529790 n=1 Tax=Mercenaria mercenaria TaxID=6596 RepID=UPI00234F86A6|nr:uncharacterized protein LOC123529790 [Mercenaria mercenaria]